jgi:hypothetical protein
MKQFTALVMALAFTASALAAPAPQDASGSSAKNAKKSTGAKVSMSSIASQLDRMQKAIDAQQQQIEQLRQQVQTKDQAMQQLQQKLDQSQTTAADAQSKADAAASQATQQQQAVTQLSSDVSDIKQNSANTALSLQETQKSVNELESPLALHFKGVTLTPGGFLAAETVWRQRALGADINTPFNSIPFGGANQSNISEFFASGRQSRISLLTEGKLKSAKLTGYVEADFLSAGVTSNNNESNSYTLRQRQVWGQASLNSGWTFTGGQMWSLVTETKKGMDNRTEALPMTIDPQYTVGFSWARQYGFRVTKNWGNKFWAGFSVENPETTLTAHGQSANFLVGQLGNSGGLYNAFNANYSYNSSPDFVFKLAAEPGFGHYEVFGILSQFRDRIFPCATAATGVVCGGVTGPSAALASNDSRTGGGFGANARWSVYQKHVDIGLHAVGGDGIGRYGTSGLSDVTVRPDGTLAPIRNYQGLFTLEWHSPKIDVYGNAGSEYDQRTWFVAAKPVGYGAPGFVNSGCGNELPPTGSAGFTPTSPANCTGDTRNTIEGTFGFWYHVYTGSKGKIQFGPQYSYIVRNTWSGTPGEPHSVENMFLTSFRYYLP